MFPLFFASKLVERLIGPGISADDLNDDVLGLCPDALFEADVSSLCQVFSEYLFPLFYAIHAPGHPPDLTLLLYGPEASQTAHQ